MTINGRGFARLTQQEAANQRGTAGVCDELVQAAANAAGASPTVANAIGTDAGTILNERAARSDTPASCFGRGGGGVASW